MAGAQHEGRILAGYYGFIVNISFTFQAVNGPIYTRDRSSVQTDHPSRRIIRLV